ncbi:MAG: FAD-dependent thymidylate synthase [Bacilli bacterium]
MKLIKPSYEIISKFDTAYLLQLIEKAGRTCYKSEHKITNDSAKAFIKMILDRHHESVIEHGSMTVRFIIDRGVSHELVRHRLSSFSQESTRYCNYTKDKFDNQLTFIIPTWLTDLHPDTYIKGLNSDFSNSQIGLSEWIDSMFKAEETYNSLIFNGWTAQQARSVLPNSLKTEIVVTSNFRQWRTIFKQRTSLAAHPQMREIMVPLLADVKNRIPIIFDDI